VFDQAKHSSFLQRNGLYQHLPLLGIPNRNSEILGHVQPPKTLEKQELTQPLRNSFELEQSFFANLSKNECLVSTNTHYFWSNFLVFSKSALNKEGILGVVGE